MAARSRTDGAKMMAIFWCLLAFIGSGFEHVVANQIVFALGMFAGVHDASAASFATNMLYAGLGNLVGGAVLVGAAYGFIGMSRPQEAAAEVVTGMTSAEVAQHATSQT